MTVREAIDQADALRPGNPFDSQLKQRWLREADGLIRKSVIDRSDTEDYDGVGADAAAWEYGLDDDVQLLAPPPYEAMYPHWLCSQIDLALGETDRYMAAAQQYNSLLMDFAGWMRRRYMPRSNTRFTW